VFIDYFDLNWGCYSELESDFRINFVVIEFGFTPNKLAGCPR